MSAEIEALLKKIELLAPSFGRAQGDLTALVSRGRAGDYKGVLQNSRLVLEMLLRAMVTTELKQTPGKAMLDELITKFRQQANAGIIPTNVLAHMGTVQAWGNLSSHDHAGSLHDEGVRVDLDEALTSLNSMVAILGWYAQKYPAPGAPSSHSTKPPPPVSAPAAPKRRLSKMALIAVWSSVIAAVAVPVTLKFAKGRSLGDRGALDAFYARVNEPLPPPACQATDPNALQELTQASRLLGDGRSEEDGEEAAARIEAIAGPRSPEQAFLLARAQLQANRPAEEPASAAAACAHFAAALNLAGKERVIAASRMVGPSAELAEKRRAAMAQADRHFRQAIDLGAQFTKPAFNLAVLKLKQAGMDSAQLDEVIGLLKGVVAVDANNKDAHYYLGLAYNSRAERVQGASPDGAEAARSLCTAARLGHEAARAMCARWTDAGP